MGPLIYVDYINQRQIWLDNLADQTYRDTLIVQAAISHTNSQEELQHVVDAIGENLNRGSALTATEHDQKDAIQAVSDRSMDMAAEHEPGTAEGTESPMEMASHGASDPIPIYEIFILDSDSVVLASNLSTLIGQEMAQSMTAPVLEAGAEFDSGVMSHMDHESHFGTLALYRDQDSVSEIYGDVHLAQPMTVVEMNLNSFFRQRLLLFGALGAVLFSTVSLAMKFLIVHPLQRFTQQLGAVKAGDFTTSIRISTEDEIGRLAQAFNYMVLALQQGQQDRQKVHDELGLRVEQPTADLNAANERLRSEITQRKQLETEREGLLSVEREQRRLAETLGRVGIAMSATLDLPELLDLICQESVSIFEVETAFVWLRQGEDLVGFAGRGIGLEQFIGMTIPISDPVTLGARIVREKRPIFVNEAIGSAEVNQQLAEVFRIEALLGVPLIKGDKAVGALVVIDTEQPQRFGPDDVQTASVLGSQAAVAIENAQLYQETQRRMRRLTALREIDTAITSSLDLRFTLKVLLDQVIQALDVHAADVLLFDASAQTLEYAAGCGFHSSALRHTLLRLGEGHAGRAALERRIVRLPDLAENPGELVRSPQLPAEAFAACFAVPLIAKGQVNGVLEIFHREPLVPQPEWIDFLETLAGQAALAIDNATLFESLQRSSTNLSLAYDRTLEGWAKALELRDRETEGHSQRVTEMALSLARATAIDEKELVHVRRGALLHDISKMGIPDRILLKPGPLSEAEWEMMRQHPRHAFEMLSPIDYLHPALDIPYCHHEKWDGTGYPRGLRGEQIPMAARIFAVVDVWDALRSDRPYRKAWSAEKARAYISGQSGTHFDPQVVEAFLRILREEHLVGVFAERSGTNGRN